MARARRARRARRRLSMTSLIDVIFLLLLFFMLTSTFSKFSEVELTAGGAGQGAETANVPPLFLQVDEDVLALNGETVAMETLEASLTGIVPEGEAQPVLVSLRDGVTAQRLTDLLVVLRAMPGLRVTVLGAA
ncbi:MAG: biopolymer transporter ExbD [Pseudomonadota bacterium]